MLCVNISPSVHFDNDVHRSSSFSLLLLLLERHWSTLAKKHYRHNDSMTTREAILRNQIEEVKKQIAERKLRHAELQEALSEFPSREALEVSKRDVTQRLEDTRKELQATVDALEPLQAPEQQAFQLCARLHRLESYCDKAELWVDKELRPNVEADIAKETEAAEVEVAALVEDLQGRRDEAVEKLAALRDRIRTRAADMRRGYHREPPKREALIDQGGESARQPTVERSVSPRAQAYEEVDDETYEISTYNDRLSDELEQLQERQRRLTKLRSKYHSELLHLKQDNRKEQTALDNSVRQVERNIARDQRIVQQLHSTNSALVSTLQMLMGQLNVEHYGTLVGPAAIEQNAKRQEAIYGKQSSRSYTVEVPRIADRPATAGPRSGGHSSRVTSD